MAEGKGPIRFGVFEADLMSRTLRKRGVRIRLQELPFRLLAMLLARPGEVVTREELKNELWAEEDYGEFDLGLNTAVKKLRQALDDSANTPRFIETIPKVGYRFIGSAATDAAPAGAAPVPASPFLGSPSRTWLHLAWIAPTAALAIVLVSRPAPVVDHPVRRWSFAPEGLLTAFQSAAVSPSGRHIAYLARESGVDSIWLRDLDDLTPRKLPGTDGAAHGFSWSPDSQWIAFFARAQVGELPQLRKIATTGGSPVTLSELPGGSGGSSWSADGKTIFFSAGGRLYEISSIGGEYSILEQLETPKGELNWTPYSLPSQPSGRGMLATVGFFEQYDLVFKNLETGEASVLASGEQPAYSPTGHIVFSETRAGLPTLWALPFDLATLQVRGEALRIADFAQSATVSDDGTLVYVDPGRRMQRLVWRARNGAYLGQIGQPQAGLWRPAISGDGRRVAVVSADAGSQDVWVHDADRAVKNRITHELGPELFPMWSSSGRELLYRAGGRGGELADIVRKSADGVGESVPLVTGGVDVLLDWSRDGWWILFLSDLDGRELRYLNVLDQEDEREPLPFLDTQFRKPDAKFSPDGRFVAYCSDRTGNEEVYISPFPSGEWQKQISPDGGCQPRWSSDGGELFYVRDDTLLAVKLTMTPALAISAASPLFTHANLTRRTGGGGYDVAPDGRFVLIEPAPGADGNVAPSIQVVENWYEEFRGRER